MANYRKELLAELIIGVCLYVHLPKKNHTFKANLWLWHIITDAYDRGHGKILYTAACMITIDDNDDNNNMAIKTTGVCKPVSSPPPIII